MTTAPTGFRHPREKQHTPGFKETDFLPSAITYAGHHSGDHRRDYGLVAAHVVQHPSFVKPGTDQTDLFRRAVSLVRDNGYVVSRADLLALSGDSAEAEALRTELAACACVNPTALRVTEEHLLALRDYLAQRHPGGEGANGMRPELWT